MLMLLVSDHFFQRLCFLNLHREGGNHRSIEMIDSWDVIIS